MERVIADLTGQSGSASDRVSGGGDGNQAVETDLDIGKDFSSTYRGSRGLDPEFIAKIEEQFGLDKPVHERYFQLLSDYAQFDLGESYFQNKGVIELIIEICAIVCPKRSKKASNTSIVLKCSVQKEEKALV